MFRCECCGDFIEEGMEQGNLYSGLLCINCSWFADEFFADFPPEEEDFVEDDS